MLHMKWNVFKCKLGYFYFIFIAIMVRVIAIKLGIHLVLEQNRGTKEEIKTKWVY